MSTAERAARASRDRGGEWSAPVFVISVAAEMADMHPQTLRQYDRLGLVVPQRQGGRQRRYSRADVELLRTIQSLSREGVSLEGIRRIVALQREVEQLQDTVADLASQVDRLHRLSPFARVFTVGAEGDVSARWSGGHDDGARVARERRAAGVVARRDDGPRAAADPRRAARPSGRGATVRELTSARALRVLSWNPAKD